MALAPSGQTMWNDDLSRIHNGSSVMVTTIGDQTQGAGHAVGGTAAGADAGTGGAGGIGGGRQGREVGTADEEPTGDEAVIEFGWPYRPMNLERIPAAEVEIIVTDYEDETAVLGTALDAPHRP